VNYLVNIFPDFEEDVQLLLELAELEVERVGAAHLGHDVEDVLNLLDLKEEDQNLMTKTRL